MTIVIATPAARTLLKPRRATSEHETQLARFLPALQPALQKLMLASKAHADLLVSFPAAAISLVTKRLTARERASALKLVRAGRPLKEIAAALRLPMWLRRLPPEALYEPLPANLDPGDRAFGRGVVNAAPATVKPGATWLAQVLTARALCDDEFALWWARRCWDALRPDMIAPVAAFAWFSKHPQHAAYRYLRTAWSSRAALAVVAHEAHLWHVRMILDAQAREARGDPHHLTGARHAGYEFVALDTAAALQEEGRLMGHCVADYAERAAIGYSRLFGVRQGGSRLATMEIRYREGAAVGIEQICGPRNRTPDQDLLRAAYAWAHALCTMPGCSALYGPAPINLVSWKLLWQPYVGAKAAEGVTVPAAPVDANAILNRTRELMAAAIG